MLASVHTVAEVLAEAEEQLKKSQEMARRREKFQEESNLHLKNIAQQIQELYECTLPSFHVQSFPTLCARRIRNNGLSNS